MSNLVLGLLFPMATIDTTSADNRASTVLNDVMPGLITIAVVGVWLGAILIGKAVPDLLASMVQIVVGFYFGQHVAMAAARGIISSNAASALTASSVASTTAAATVAATKAATDATTAAVAAGSKQ